MSRRETYENFAQCSRKESYSGCVNGVRNSACRKSAIVGLLGSTREDRISVIVRNTQTNHRLLEKDNELIQKLYPIFLMPEYSSNPLSFRAQFYQPYKFFFGSNIPTQWFNVGIIWLMSVILIVTLYFDVLKRVISGKRKQ